jgi:hypothetical protein
MIRRMGTGTPMSHSTGNEILPVMTEGFLREQGGGFIIVLE